MSALGIIELHRDMVYGPVSSRRLGRSLGINLLPGEIKVCSLDCGYCQFSWTGILSIHPKHFQHFLPEKDRVLARLESALRDLARNGTPPDRITFSGNGEPTLHPDFPEIVEGVLSLRDKYAPESSAAALSNSLSAGRADIRAALMRLDEPVMKLDAGSEAVFRRVNRPARDVHFEEVLEGLEAMGSRIVLQAMFVDGSVSNVSDKDVEDWCAAVRRIGPRAVQIYTVSRGTADQGLTAVPAGRLNEINRRLEEIWGGTGKVYLSSEDGSDEP